MRPFHGYLVRSDLAPRVVAPPRGHLDRAERDELGRDEPLSILNVVRSGSSIPPERRPEHRLASARRLRSLLRDGVFVPMEEPRYLVYRSTDGDHSVTGLITEVPISRYEHGHLKPHERIRDDQVQRMADHIDEVGAQSLPVMLGYRPPPDLDAILDTACAGEALVDVTVDGARQTLWPVPAARTEELRRTLADIEDLYIADGHHRIEAVRRVAERRRRAAGATDAGGPIHHLLAVLVPADRLETAPYHRWVADTGGADPSELPRSLTDRGFDVQETGSEPVEPARNGRFGMLLEGTWFRLSAPRSPTDRLDVDILHEEILTPLLGIGDPDEDPRIGFVSGAGGVSGLSERCRQDGGIGFSLAPTAVRTVFDVADEGGVMPPKSTWFVPKLTSGLALHMFEGLAGPGGAPGT